LNFFDRLFGKEKKGGSSDEIGSGELRSLLEGRIKTRREEIYGECAPLLKEIFSDAEGINAAALLLGARDLQGVMHVTAHKIILSSRPKFVRGVVNALSSLERKPADYDELVSFGQGLHAALSALAKLNVGEGRYLPIAFGEDMEDIRKRTKRLALNASKLGENIGSDVAILSSALESLDKVDSLGEEQRKLAGSKPELEDRIVACETKISGLEAELDSLDKSPEFEELKKFEAGIKDAESHLESIEQQIFNRLSPLERPIRKFRKSAKGSGYDPHMLKRIDEYMQDPVKCFLSDDDCELMQMLADVRDAAVCGKFDLKDKDKLLARIDAALGIDGRELRSEHSRLIALRCDLRKRAESSPIKERRKSIGDEILRLKREMGDKIEESRRLMKHGGDIEGRIAEMRAELERKLEKLGGPKIKVRL
jgi:predicted  nucleic acid-binding Zn-ribbon protein